MKSILNYLIGSSFLSLSTWKSLHSLQEHIRKFSASSSYKNNLRQEKTVHQTGPKIKRWQQRGRQGTRIEPFSLQPLGCSLTSWVSRCGPSPPLHISELCARRKATCSLSKGLTVTGVSPPRLEHILCTQDTLNICKGLSVRDEIPAPEPWDQQTLWQSLPWQQGITQTAWLECRRGTSHTGTAEMTISWSKVLQESRAQSGRVR